MGSLYRSRSMSYVRLLMAEESAYDTIRQLGDWGELMVVDLSANSQQAALSERVTRLKKRIGSCLYWEKRLETLRDIMKEYGVALPDSGDADGVRLLDVRQADVLEAAAAYIDPLDAAISKNIQFKRDQTLHINSVTERMHVIDAVMHPDSQSDAQRKRRRQQQQGDERPRDSGYETYGSFSATETSGLLAPDADESKETDVERGRRAPRTASPLSSSSSSSFSSSSPASPSSFQSSRARFISSSLYGTVPSSSAPLLERLMFRISRGNAILRLWPIDEQLADTSAAAGPTGGPAATVSKSVFMVTYVGEEMEKKLRRLLAVVGATEYDVPAPDDDRERLLRALRQQRAEVWRVVGSTDLEIREQLSVLALDAQQATSPYHNWQVGLHKERGICDTLRRCEQSDNSRMLVCEGWVQTQHLTQLQATLAAAVSRNKLQQAVLQVVPASAAQQQPPPTYFPTNKFTAAFQAIVDTYGVPRYKEINPGLFTVISFPFLFGVMYGDIGHGSILTLAALYLLYSERRMAEQQRRGHMNEIVGMVFGGRYLLLLMGLFAVYCGFVYNDCFSIPVPLFPSSLHFTRPHHQPHAVPAVSQHGVYPFGVDWQWYHSSNELAFFNSLKMKTSVLLGVTQMTFGILLSAANDVFFHDLPAVWLEFVPRLLFMLCTFGYMCALIIYKWTVDFSQPDAPPAANLIQTMINMFLSPGHVDRDKQLYAGQGAVQAALLAVALLSVPVMLLGVPLVERREHAREALHEANLRAADADDDAGRGPTKRRTSPAAEQQQRGGDDDEELKQQPDTAVTRRQSSQRRRRKGGYEQVNVHDGDSDADTLNDEEKQLASALTPGGFYQGAAFTSAAPAPPLTAPRPAHASAPTGSPHPLAYSFSDALITQSIHTIEFVLGCVSNTASYLRLWALSLAHAQLAAVFWQKMVQQYGVQTGSVALTVAGVAVWSGATFAVLLCMDVLECFLHALRLHWVEFQNKFYKADGVPFEPFSFSSADKTD